MDKKQRTQWKHLLSEEQLKKSRELWKENYFKRINNPAPIDWGFLGWLENNSIEEDDFFKTNE